MDRHAATRRLMWLAQTAGIHITRAHPRMFPYDHARCWRRLAPCAEGSAM